MSSNMKKDRKDGKNDERPRTLKVTMQDRRVLVIERLTAEEADALVDRVVEAMIKGMPVDLRDRDCGRPCASNAHFEHAPDEDVVMMDPISIDVSAIQVVVEKEKRTEDTADLVRSWLEERVKDLDFERHRPYIVDRCREDDGPTGPDKACRDRISDDPDRDKTPSTTAKRFTTPFDLWTCTYTLDPDDEEKEKEKRRKVADARRRLAAALVEFTEACE